MKLEKRKKTLTFKTFKAAKLLKPGDEWDSGLTASLVDST